MFLLYHLFSQIKKELQYECIYNSFILTDINFGKSPKLIVLYAPYDSFHCFYSSFISLFLIHHSFNKIKEFAFHILNKFILLNYPTEK